MMPFAARSTGKAVFEPSYRFSSSTVKSPFAIGSGNDSSSFASFASCALRLDHFVLPPTRAAKGEGYRNTNTAATAYAATNATTTAFQFSPMALSTTSRSEGNSIVSRAA